MIPQMCPLAGISCSLWYDGVCQATETYNHLLNVWYPNIATLPFGEDCIPLQKDLAKTICKHIRKFMSPCEELERPASAETGLGKTRSRKLHRPESEWDY